MDDNGVTFLCDMMKAGPTESTTANGPKPKYLVLLRGDVPGRMIGLSGGRQLIGRDGQATIQLAEMSLSRRHAALVIDPEGSAQLTDLGSTNGTFRNGRRLEPEAPIAIRDGDRLGFGPRVVAKFTCPDLYEERCQRELFERAVRDPLTGLYNRGYFLDQAPRLEARASAANLGFALMMLDIDHFKKVNDTLGHDAGDDVLREVAQVLRNSTRTDDLVARYGGEEFVAALPIASPEQAIERAEKIREALARRRISAGGKLLRVTASIGLAVVPKGGHVAINTLISSADIGLYQAKRTGRDRVVYRAEIAESPSTKAITTVDYVSSL